MRTVRKIKMLQNLLIVYFSQSLKPAFSRYLQINFTVWLLLTYYMITIASQSAPISLLN
jgi:hypothetical protein